MDKKIATIKDWEIIKHPIYNDYVLLGQVSNHARQNEFKKDQQITSPLQLIDFKNKTAETLNTIYKLED